MDQGMSPGFYYLPSTRLCSDLPRGNFSLVKVRFARGSVVAGSCAAPSLSRKRRAIIVVVICFASGPSFPRRRCCSRVLLLCSCPRAQKKGACGRKEEKRLKRGSGSGRELELKESTKERERKGVVIREVYIRHLWEVGEGEEIAARVMQASARVGGSG